MIKRQTAADSVSLEVQADLHPLQVVPHVSFSVIWKQTFKSNFALRN